MRESEEKTETIHSYQQRGHTACFQLSVCLLVFFHTLTEKCATHIIHHRTEYILIYCEQHNLMLLQL